ncbi:ATP-binding protein [Cyanobium sp. Alchichica 3B3-8F6]|nr:ATP-binding protein [Cyanobium sp. Alchichica 3B3-8F6]
MTASQQAASSVLLDIDQAARQVLAVEPRLVLEGARPRLLDEWQVAPELWNQVRRAVDASDQPGQFLLTGSAVPADDASRHTGAGRFGFLRMRPMSLFESGVSNGAVSLRQLFAGEVQAVADPGMSVQDLTALIARGGWPAQQGRPLKAASRAARDYLEQVRQVDISRVDDRRRDPARVGALLRSLGRHCATEAKLSTLAADAGGADGPLDERTVTDYLQALERLMVIEDQAAWAPHLRSRARLRKAPKRHFVDPSLALAATGAAPERLLQDFEWFGLLFESLVIRDLRVLSQFLDGEVLHYRDDYGVEVDAIVQLRDGRWGAIEIKLGEGQVEQAAANLKRFSEQIDSQRSGSPAFLAVICGKGYGYPRADGVVVVPVGALGP